MRPSGFFVATASLLTLGACAGRPIETDLSLIASSTVGGDGSNEVCVIGYIVSDEGVYLNSSSVDTDLSSIAVIPARRRDALAMAEHRGKRVKLCGLIVPDKECISGERICTPRSNLLHLLRLRFIQPS